MSSVVTPPATISKCQQKILDIQNNHSIKYLYENNLKYQRVKDLSIQNPYSKIDFNLYQNYQKLQRNSLHNKTASCSIQYIILM